ncbi:MAG TPA: hypothetical protein PKA28_08375 [Methylomusa anaerophila]|uniref:DUF3789 domain-containing protein n=1 Tax=Methylomusa anaerophila TaxID=1930071 RepID=A0A348AL70_9FIRM|nr:hypothetical protein [Methylomusa anaerophila]BBB91818.1 hypothetical protein MAMMFC1_02503 [Methylomusa anaerophila]HML88449.1 hypothetical protein [Methylomusa anaerophila]
MVNSFWNGFAVGAFLFSIVGAVTGTLIAALCHIAAKGKSSNEF